jgi:hypothetical protein
LAGGCGPPVGIRPAVRTLSGLSFARICGRGITSPETVDELPPRPKPLQALPQAASTVYRHTDAAQQMPPGEWPTIRGYEVLAELGRGGMGWLVYGHVQLRPLLRRSPEPQRQRADPRYGTLDSCGGLGCRGISIQTRFRSIPRRSAQRQEAAAKRTGCSRDDHTGQ